MFSMCLPFALLYLSRQIWMPTRQYTLNTRESLLHSSLDISLCPDVTLSQCPDATTSHCLRWSPAASH